MCVFVKLSDYFVIFIIQSGVCVCACSRYMIKKLLVSPTKALSITFASSTAFQRRGGRSESRGGITSVIRAQSRKKKSPPPAAIKKKGEEEERRKTTMKDNGQSIASEMVLAKPKDISESDFANYFCTYGYLYHQKDMLEDQDRMTAYYNAVKMNPSQFEDKVVLDVGTGSGILAIWAAQAGAKHVYAVEATFMATQDSS